MRIAIDARELAGQPTGVGRYLSEILEAWGTLPAAAQHEFVLCAPPDGTLPSVSGLRTSVVRGRGHGTLWEQLTLPRLLRSIDADVLFAPAYSGPLMTSVPVVVAIHDVSFAAHPHWYPRLSGARRRLLTRLTARRAARVLTISDFSKREIVAHLGVAPDHVDVIYPGVTSFAADAGGGTSHATVAGMASVRPFPRQVARNRDEPLVLYVGSIFNRRHIPAVIAGFTRLAAMYPAARLELVGDNRTSPHIDIDALIARSTAGGRIKARSYVPDTELAWLYKSASAFIFLSDYEGFGLTPLEALAAGVPVVVLDTDVAREIYGPAALYLQHPEPDVICSALDTAISDDETRTRLLGASRQVLQRYSWQECGRRTLQILMACARPAAARG